MWKFIRKHPRVALCFVIVQIFSVWIPIALLQQDRERFPTETPNFICVLLLIVGIFGPIIYFQPTFIANKRRQRNFDAIFLTNLLAGWTVIGWVVAIVWATLESGRLPPEPIIAPIPQPPTRFDLWYERHRKWILTLVLGGIALWVVVALLRSQ